MNPYGAAALVIFLFLAAQAFQQLAFAYRISPAKDLTDNLRTYLLPVDQARALVVGGSILLLVVPYSVIALRYFAVAPIFSLLGLIFGLGFVGCELTHRSLDYFLVGTNWARQLDRSTGLARESLLQRFTLWNDITHAWYFPLLLSHLLASFCFLRVTWIEAGADFWSGLAPMAFGLNALRLLGRLLSMFAGQSWLNGLNARLYFPAVLLINLLLLAWFLHLAVTS
jgi:hypothetical protein